MSLSCNWHDMRHIRPVFMANCGSTIIYLEDLVQSLQRNFCPAEYQNPDKYLCSIKQIGSSKNTEEYAKQSARVSN
ncbi:unnamed protein product [Cuscuta campestris]|uniref:Uncharacterized protein n=1 Tax=Cuscuta campestris TaxID=132261 RepID=A0A484N0G8_9ASTE|nr:unnamed protein product [Cuscuta campestris]